MLFNKDTFYPDISVKSIYLHDTRRVLQDHIVEGEHGWVLQGVVSRASFRRAAASGQKVFTVLSLHINNVLAKKRGIAKKIIQTVRALMMSLNIDLVAGVFGGARFSSTKTPSILISASNRSTFMIRGGVYKIKSLKVNKDGFCKAFFHVPLFVVLQLVVRSSLLCCPCISATFMPRKKVLPRKSFRLVVLL